AQSGTAGVCADQSGDSEFHESALQAPYERRYPRQCGGARTRLDAADPVDNQSEKDQGFWEEYGVRKAGATGGASAAVRVSGLAGFIVYDGRGGGSDRGQDAVVIQAAGAVSS